MYTRSLQIYCSVYEDSYHNDVSHYVGSSSQLWMFSILNCLAGIFGSSRRFFLLEEIEVEAHTSQEVLGLSHVHPETLQFHAVQVTVLGHERENLFLDAHGFQLQEQGANFKSCDWRANAKILLL